MAPERSPSTEPGEPVTGSSAGRGPEDPGMAPEEACLSLVARGQVSGLLGGDPKTLGWLPKRPGLVELREMFWYV